MKNWWGTAGVVVLVLILLRFSIPTEAGIWPERVPYVNAQGTFVAGAPVGVESAPTSPGNVTAARFPFRTDGCHLMFSFRLNWAPGGVTAQVNESEVFLGSPMLVELHSSPAGAVPLRRWMGSGGQLLGAYEAPLSNESAYEVRVGYLAGLGVNFTFVGLGQRTTELGCVVVNEIEANPAGTDAGNEWIELYNPSNRSIPVGDWSILSSAGQVEELTLPPGTRLDAGEYLVITFASQFLDNAGDSVKLVHPLDSIVEETPWHVDQANSPNTWQRSPDAGENWTFANGTQGSSNV